MNENSQMTSSSASFYISTENLCVFFLFYYLIQMIFSVLLTRNRRKMRTLKLIEIASDWLPYLVISPFLRQEPERPNGWKNCLYIYISSSFIFFFLLSFSFPYLKKKSRVQQSKMSCEVIGSRSNANISLIPLPLLRFSFFFFLFLFLFFDSLQFSF